MGGSMNFGPVMPEPDEPVFHADWERRALAVTLAMGAAGQWNIDMSRSERESLAPVDYLASTYYEIWTKALERLLIKKGLVSEAEIRAGHAIEPARVGIQKLLPARVAAMLAAGSPTSRASGESARFGVGDLVRTLNLHPAGHTRLPRYVRGRPGQVLALHGWHVFPDTHARGEGECPQWLYTVKFRASDLWGADTTADSVCVDCWESYLAPVDKDLA